MAEFLGADENVTSAFGEDFSPSVFEGNSSDLNATQLKDRQYFATDYRIIGTLFGIIIFVVGVVGNVMVVVVVKRTKSMQSPTNCYLVSLAIADCLVLFAAVPNEVIGYYLLVGEWIWGKIGCSLLVFLQYLGINASSLSITAFTVERYIAICHPMKAQVVCTMERAKKIIIGLWAFAILYCAPWLPLTTTFPLSYKGAKKETCDYKLSREMYTWIFLGDFVMFYVIPLLLSCILYGLIGKILFTNTIPKTPGTGKSNGHASDSKKSATSSRVQACIHFLVFICCCVVMQSIAFCVLSAILRKKPFYCCSLFIELNVRQIYCVRFILATPATVSVKYCTFQISGIGA